MADPTIKHLTIFMLLKQGSVRENLKLEKCCKISLENSPSSKKDIEFCKDVQ